MSISKVHELIQNKGCVWTVSILMVLSMVVGSFTMCNNPNMNADNATRLNPGTVIAQVGEYGITEQLVQTELERGSAMYGGLENLPPSFQLQLQAGVLRSTIGNIIQLEMAKKYGIEPSDQDIQKLVAENINQELDRVKQQFVMQQKLKPEATQAEFAALFKKETGRDIAQVKEEAIKTNAELLRGGSAMRIPLAAMAVSQPLMDAIKKEIKLTDAELKATYDTFEFKRITFIKGDRQAKADKVKKELAGGLSFETAIDRYSEATPEAGKKLSEKVEPIGRISLRGFEVYQPLEKMKAGQVSEPITIGDSVNIFKLIRIKSELPKDFDAKKQTYLDTQLTSLAAGKLQEEMVARQKDIKVDWKSNVHRMVYDYGRLTAENLSVEERDQLQKKILEEALAASTQGEAHEGRTAGTLAYVVFQNIYTTASPEEKKKLDDQKIQVYETYLTDNEDPSMRLELVEVYKREKNADGFKDQLMAAANANLGQVDAAGQGVFNEINKWIKEGETSKLLAAEDVKLLRDIQKQWVDQKTEQDKYEAEAKKAEEDAKKQADADAKKAASEVKTREEANKEKAAGGKK